MLRMTVYLLLLVAVMAMPSSVESQLFCYVPTPARRVDLAFSFSAVVPLLLAGLPPPGAAALVMALRAHA